MKQIIRKIFWLGSAKKDLKAMPDDVQDTFGYALHQAQIGKRHEHTKPLKGFGSAGVLEVVEDFGSSTFRAVYTVKFGHGIYVLHCFQKKMKEIHGRINSFIKKKEIVYVRKTEAQDFSTKLNTGRRIIDRLLKESKNITSTEDLAKKTKGSITRLEISTCVDNIKNISEQSGFFSFLQLVSDRNLNTRPWSELFHKIVVYLSGTKKNIENNIYQAAEKINKTINHHTKSIAKEIEEYYINKMESLEVEKLPVELNKGHGIILNLTEEINNLTSAQELSNKISDSMIKSNLATTKIRSSISSVFHHGKYLEFLKFLNNGTLDTWSSAWIIPLNNAEKYLADSEIWYNFLNYLYTKFSEYEIQEDTTKYNVFNVDDWGILDKSQGIQIDKRNFNQFLEKIKKYDSSVYNTIKKLEVTEFQLKELNRILYLTIKKGIYKFCSESGKLVIKGDYIKFTDFTNADGKILHSCSKKSNLNSIDIFALNTIFIDRDIQEIGSKLQVSIIAPKWQIKGSRKINLDGASGVSYASKAESGDYPGNKGSDGLPGRPGGAAGNFLGIGKEFIDSKHLTITANGGKGGPGQQGGNGAAGPDGEKARKEAEFTRRQVNACLGIESFFDIPIPVEIIRYITDSRCNENGNNYVFYQKDVEDFIYSGHSGGNGGSGGVGGLGGINGDIKIVRLNNSLNIQDMIIYNYNGSLGEGGTGGNGGAGGKKGNDILVSWCKAFDLFRTAAKLLALQDSQLTF